MLDTDFILLALSSFLPWHVQKVFGHCWHHPIICMNVPHSSLVNNYRNGEVLSIWKAFVATKSISRYSTNEHKSIYATKQAVGVLNKLKTRRRKTSVILKNIRESGRWFGESCSLRATDWRRWSESELMEERRTLMGNSENSREDTWHNLCCLSCLFSHWLSD